MSKPLVERLLLKMVKVDDCWEWIAYKNPDGYGKIRVEGKTLMAHRVSYSIFRGQISDKMTIDHLCRNKGCINPFHLEVVTRSENSKRSAPWNHNRKKTTCPKDHPYRGENLFLRKDGSRMCRECHRARVRGKSDA